MSSHLTMVAKYCAAFTHASTWICEIASYSNADEWGPLITAAYISSGVQLRPTETGHPTHAYCSNKFSTRCQLALHLGNTRPRNFLSLTKSSPVNSSSNLSWSLENTVDHLYFHQCHGTLSCFNVGCTATANSLDSHFLLRLALDWECTSNSCLKFSAWNCRWCNVHFSYDDWVRDNH